MSLRYEKGTLSRKRKTKDACLTAIPMKQTVVNKISQLNKGISSQSYT